MVYSGKIIYFAASDRKISQSLDGLGKHNQIPELLAHYEQGRRQYLVQEFADGANLLQELNGSGRFSGAKIKDLLLDLLPVLHFIHAGRVIHRDITALCAQTRTKNFCKSVAEQHFYKNSWG